MNVTRKLRFMLLEDKYIIGVRRETHTQRERQGERESERTCFEKNERRLKEHIENLELLKNHQLDNWWLEASDLSIELRCSSVYTAVIKIWRNEKQGMVEAVPTIVFFEEG